MSAVSAAAMLMSPVNGGPVIPSSLNTGMLGYWKLDGNSNDSIGSNNGTDNLVTYVSAKVNQGATFGPGGYIDLGSDASIKPRAGMSVAAWVKWNSYQANSRHFTDWHQYGGADRFILAYDYGDGRIAAIFVIYPDGVTNQTVVMNYSNAMPLGTWQHLCATYDEPTSTVKIYLNAVLIDTFVGIANTTSPTMVTIGETVRIGAQAEAGGTADVTSDEHFMWNRALTALEVQGLVDAGNYGIQAPF